MSNSRLRRPAVEDQGKAAKSILLGLSRRACRRVTRAYADSFVLSASSVSLTFQERSAKGLCKAIQDIFGTDAQVPRCTWHNRENVEGHPKENGSATLRHNVIQQKRPRAALRAADPYHLTGTLAWMPMFAATCLWAWIWR